MFVDLHIHTTRSDGTFTPRQLLEALNAQQVSIFSVTDHNRMPQTKLLTRMAQARQLTYYTGAEIDCLFQGYDIHLLIYGFLPTATLAKLAKQAKEQLLQMSVDLIELLIPNYPQLSLTDYALFEDDPSKGGWKGIRYLVARGVAPDFPSAMALYPQYGILYENYPFPSVKEVCDACHKAGGVAILAHPGASHLARQTQQELTSSLLELLDLGVDGIECFHPRNQAPLTQFVTQFCLEHNLYRTAGSDSHGEFPRSFNGVAYAVGHPRATKEELALPPLQSNK